MQERKVITANNLQDLADQLFPDFATGLGLQNYQAALQVNGHVINLDISSSPGGNMEGGYESTMLHAVVATPPGFVFVIYPEDFLNRIGKLFGLQDVVLGYPEFDHNVIVKTENPDSLKVLFADADARQLFQTLSGYSLKLDKYEDNEDHYLDLSIQRAITNPAELQRILSVFHTILTSVA